MAREDEAPESANLNERQVAFCREYLLDLNATQAYIRAGYARDGAASSASKLLRNPKVAALIARMQADRAERVQIDADRVLAEVARLAFSDVRGIFAGRGALRPVVDLDDDIAAAVQSVKVVTRAGAVDDEGNLVAEDVLEYKLADKRGSLKLLMDHLGIANGSDSENDSIVDALREIAERLPD